MAFDPYSLNEILRALLLGGAQGGGSALGNSSAPEQIFPPSAPQFPIGNQANPNIRLMPSRTGGVYTNYDIPSGQLYGSQLGNQNMGAEMPLPYVLPGDTETEQYVNEQMAKAAAVQKAQADEAQRQADLEKVKAPKYIEQETEKMKLIAQAAKTQEEGRSRQIEEWIKSREKLQEFGAKPEDLTQFDNRILGIIGGGANQGGVSLKSQIEGHAKQMMDTKGWQSAMDEAVATNDLEKRKIAVDFLNNNKPTETATSSTSASGSQPQKSSQPAKEHMSSTDIFKKDVGGVLTKIKGGVGPAENILDQVNRIEKTGGTQKVIQYLRAVKSYLSPAEWQQAFQYNPTLQRYKIYYDRGQI